MHTSAFLIFALVLVQKLPLFTPWTPWTRRLLVHTLTFGRSPAFVLLLEIFESVTNPMRVLQSLVGSL
jgi:hypothetical protein